MIDLGCSASDRHALRRVRSSTSTDAFQTCDAGRAGVHLPSEALDLTSPADVLPRIERERVPTCIVARERVPETRPSGQPFLDRFLDRSDNKYILVQFTVEKQLAKPFR